MSHAIVFKEGDVLVTETSAPIWGYNAELERAMVIGEPLGMVPIAKAKTILCQSIQPRPESQPLL